MKRLDRFSCATVATAALLLTCGVTVGLAEASTATYTLTFDATWSAETHPEDFPPNPHFSPLVGGVHAAGVAFWQEGELASLGIQRMAEWGATGPLAAEVQAAIDDQLALAVVEDDQVPPSPGQATVTFDVTDAFPLVTVVSMIAPSPDWFAGVAGLNLRQGGQWVEELVVELYPYDAGTDHGISYTSPDQPSNPHGLIAAIPGSPFTPGVPVGTFTFTLQNVTSVPEAAVFALNSYPNPFNPSTTVVYRAAASGRLELTAYDVRGRQVDVLLDENVSAGTGSVKWDGRDHSGRRVPAGTYLLRLRDGAGRQAVRKIMLID